MEKFQQPSTVKEIVNDAGVNGTKRRKKSVKKFVPFSFFAVNFFSKTANPFR